VALGTAFYRLEHVFFVLSAPTPEGKVLCVNFTTLDDDCIDDECPVDSSDYAWIQPGHPTTIAFSKALVLDSALIDQCLQNGKLQAPNPPIVPAATCAKVALIGKTSRELSPERRGML
jgi:hypothetical protein